MAEYRQSAHAVFDLKYHIIWCAKYRKKVLRGRIAERARDLIRQICAARGVVIVRGATILLRDGGRSGRGDDQSLYREPAIGRRRRIV